MLTTDETFDLMRDINRAMYPEAGSPYLNRETRSLDDALADATAHYAALVGLRDGRRRNDMVRGEIARIEKIIRDLTVEQRERDAQIVRANDERAFIDRIAAMPLIDSDDIWTHDSLIDCFDDIVREARLIVAARNG